MEENISLQTDAQWLCRFDSNFSQVNAIIFGIENVALGKSDKLHWHNIDWWYTPSSVFLFRNGSTAARFNKSQLKMLFWWKTIEKGFAKLDWLTDWLCFSVIKATFHAVLKLQKGSARFTVNDFLQSRSRSGSLKLCKPLKSLEAHFMQHFLRSNKTLF